MFTLYFSDKWGTPGSSEYGSLEECYESALKMAQAKTARPLKITKGAEVIVDSGGLWQEINKRLGSD